MSTIVALLGNSSVHATIVVPTKPKNDSSYTTELQASAGLQAASSSLRPLLFPYQIDDIQNGTDCVFGRFAMCVAAGTVSVLGLAAAAPESPAAPL